MKKQIARLRKENCDISAATCQVKPFGRLLDWFWKDCKGSESKFEGSAHPIAYQTRQSLIKLRFFPHLRNHQRALK
ncbi:MAG: hypothetical protein RR946_07660, partial [Clostridia bacterium]